MEAAVPHADYVEVDARTTSDGAVVIMHDKTLERTTDLAERWPWRRTDSIDTFALHEIRRLDAGSWFGAGAPPTGVPSLHEVLEVAAGSPCGVLVEVKDTDPTPVVDLVTDFRRGRPDTHVALGSVNPEVARRLAGTVVDTAVGVLFVDQTRLSAARLNDYASFADFLGFRDDQLTEDTVARVHRAGPQAMHNTNTRSAIEAGVSGDADATMSDNPTIVGDLVAGRDVVVIEAEGLVGLVHGTASARLTEHSVPYKLSGGAAAAVIAVADRDWAVIPLGPLPIGQLVCRIATGPWGGIFSAALDDGPAVEIDSSSRGPARRDVVVGDVAAPRQHLLHIRRVPSATHLATAELTIDCIEVRPTAR